MSTELVIVDKINPAEIFKSGGIDSLLEEIRGKVASDVNDVSTLKGRKEIASLAHKVAKSKTTLDSLGKDLADKLNAQLKPINSERKKARDYLDALKEEVRKPLTEWEEAEQARVTNHEQNLRMITVANEFKGTSAELKGYLVSLEAIKVNESWEEFEAEAHREKESAINFLRSAIADAEKLEAEQAELEKLRKEKAEREEAERLEKVKQKAAEEARLEAERIAKEGKEAAERAERKAIEEKERVEREAKEAAEKAEQERIAAAERAEKEKQEAVAAEQKRIADAKAEEEAAAAKRESNKKHNAKINNQAAQAFVAGGFTEDQAKDIVRLIASGKVAHVSIAY